MFYNTIDRKQTVIDKNGNEIVDLTTSIFKKSVRGISSAATIRMTDYFQMRADKVALNQYKTDEGAEFILKYSGISNPFSLDKDDVLVIPEFDQAETQMTDYTEQQDSNEKQVQLYYKFTNTDFKSSSSSYDALTNKKIPSGVLDATETGGFTVPYISDDGTTAVTIKNGRLYFGGVPTTQNTTETTNTSTDTLADKCLTNGMTVADFVRANTNNTSTTLNSVKSNIGTLDVSSYIKI